MSAGAVVVWVFGMFFLTILAGLWMILNGMKEARREEMQQPHNPQLESVETVPLPTRR